MPDAAPFNTPPGTSQPLPAAAADAADIAPAPPAAQVLEQSALGDQGAQDAAALRGADQRAAAPPVAPSAAPAAPPAAAPIPDPAAGGLMQLLGPGGLGALTGGGGAPPGVRMGAGGLPDPDISPTGAALLGFATKNPLAGQELYAKRQAQQLALVRELRTNSAEFYTQLLPAAFKQFPGRPDLAAAFLMTEAQQRGLTVNPAVLVKLNQDMIDGKLPVAGLAAAIENSDVNALARLGEKAEAATKLFKADAEVREATAKATGAEYMNSPGMLKQKGDQGALRLANEIRSAQRLPQRAEIAGLKAGGLIPTRVPINGPDGQPIEGAFRYSTRPDDGTIKPGDIDLRMLDNLDAAHGAKVAEAKQQATLTASTKQMQEASGPVLNLVGAVRRDLQAISDPKISEALRQHPEAMNALMPTPDERAALDAADETSSPAQRRAAERAINTIEARTRATLTKLGRTDPAFAGYLMDTNLLLTALMKMHVGARGGAYILEHFDLGASRQSRGNMEGQLQKIEEYAHFVASERGTYNFDKVYGSVSQGSPAAPAAVQPPAGAASVQVPDEAAANALPKGSRFVLPDGRSGRIE